MGQLISVNSPTPEFQSDGRVYFPEGSPYINPGFSRIGMRRSQFNSFYHGLTLGLQSRLGDSFTLRGKYTWSRSIDEASNHTFNDFVASDQVPTIWDYRANRGPLGFRSGPCVRCEPLLDSVAGRRLAGRSGLRRLERPRHHSGAGRHPIRPAGRLRPGAPAPGLRRRRAAPRSGGREVGGGHRLGRPRRGTSTLKRSVCRAAGYLGNLGRGTLRGPGIFTADLALHKRLFSNDRHSVELRAEAFNVTNRPNFQVPSGRALFTASGSRIGSAGRITSTSTTSRQLQLALRWDF